MSETNTYIEWKWSIGDHYEKTLRTKHKQEEPTQFQIEQPMQTGFTRQSTKRDEHNVKLSNRCLIIQKNVNPYMDSSNYINDLMTEDTLLRPKDSNAESK